MEKKEKIVDFHKYCKNCKYVAVNETDNPCNDCLNCPTNTNTSEPINFEEK